MAGPVSRKVDGRKFMWDGRDFENETDANAAAEKYRSEGFEAVVVAGDKFHVYTRRVVTDVKIEGGPSV